LDHSSADDVDVVINDEGHDALLFVPTTVEPVAEVARHA
jgi:hypothetical protein